MGKFNKGSKVVASADPKLLCSYLLIAESATVQMQAMKVFSIRGYSMQWRTQNWLIDGVSGGGFFGTPFESLIREFCNVYNKPRLFNTIIIQTPPRQANRRLKCFLT